MKYIYYIIVIFLVCPSIVYSMNDEGCSIVLTDDKGKGAATE